jgi:hypothetical protein
LRYRQGGRLRRGLTDPFLDVQECLLADLRESLLRPVEVGAWAFARAHARSGDPAIIAGYIGSGSVFADAVAQFSMAYAEQNDRDHPRLVEAVRDGTVDAIFQD